MSRPQLGEADEDLQFQVDGLASSVEDAGLARAYSRAVCLPFSVDQDKSVAFSGLEGKVHQLVTDFFAVGGGDDRNMLATLSAHLAKHGLQAAVTAPPKPSAVSPLSTRSINAPFLVVTQPSADDRRDAAVGVQDQDQSEEVPQVVVVDPSLREHLALAPATPAYLRTLAAAAPEVFIGTRARLVRLVSSLGPAVAANFSAQGMEVPPWRRKSALLHRWSRVEELERSVRLQWEDRREERARAELAAPQSHTAEAEAVEAVQPLADFEVAWPHGMPAARAAAAMVVPIVGFAVGSMAVDTEVPWYSSQDGDFSASFFRRTSQADSDSSAADSEDVVAGLSPVSVFRDSVAPPPAKLTVGFA